MICFFSSQSQCTVTRPWVTFSCPLIFPGMLVLCLSLSRSGKSKTQTLEVEQYTWQQQKKKSAFQKTKMLQWQLSVLIFPSFVTYCTVVVVGGIRKCLACRQGWERGTTGPLWVSALKSLSWFLWILEMSLWAGTFLMGCGEDLEVLIFYRTPLCDHWSQKRARNIKPSQMTRPTWWHRKSLFPLKSS